MDLGISGRKALVCGASKGLGLAIATELAREGATLFLTSREETALEKQASMLSKSTGSIIHHHACDLSKRESRESLIAAIGEKLGALDILVHNTGGPKPSSAEQTSSEDWCTGFSQLFDSVVHLNSAFLGGMKERRWGRVLAVTSLSVMEPIANLAVSNSIRAAVTAMLKTLADELAPFDITVNCIAPGSIATDRLEQLMNARMERSGQSREEYMREYLAAIPAARLGRPEEFGAVAAFLCSEPASYITGSTIAVDGGKRRAVH